MNRKATFVLFSITLLGIAVFYYIDTIFLPIQFKQYLTVKAEKYLQRKVYIGNVDFKLLKGFVIDDIGVARRDDPARAFIKIKQLSFNLMLAPVFRRQAVIIPAIRIKDPYIYVERQDSRTWNFSDLLTLEQRLGERQYPVLLLRKFTLENGRVIFVDRTQEGGFVESFENINLNATLSLNKGIRFVGAVDSPHMKSSASVKGNYSLMSRNLSAQVMLNNIHLARYLSLAHNAPLFVELSGGVLSTADLSVTYDSEALHVHGTFAAAQTDIQIGGTKRLKGDVLAPDFRITLRGNKWDAQGRLQIPSAELSAASGKKLTGDITADLNLLTISGSNFSSQGNVSIDNTFLTVGENQFLGGNVTATNASLAMQNDTIRLQGDLDVKGAVISFNERTSLTGDILARSTHLTWEAPDEEGFRRLSVESGLLMDAAQIVFGENTYIRGNIRAHQVNLLHDQKAVSVEAKGQITEADARTGNDIGFQGNPDFHVYFRYDPEKSNPVDYSGSVHFTSGRLTGLPRVESVSNINGNAAFVPGRVTADNLTFHTQGAAFLLSGTLNDFQNPKLDLRAASEKIELQRFLALFPDLTMEVRADITVLADVEVNYKGPAFSPGESDIQLTAQLWDATVTHHSLPDKISGVSGRLKYKKDLLTWKNLKAGYRARSYTLNGSLANFSRPVIDTKITSDTLSLETQVKLLHRAFQFTKLAGNFYNTRFDLKGDVHMFDNAPMDIDLRGTFALDLRDIGDLIPRLKNISSQLQSAGVLYGEGIFKGTTEDWRNRQLAFNGGSEKIRLKGYALDNVSFRFAQRDLTVSKCDFSSAVYGGTLVMSCSSDLRDETVPFKASVDLKQMDLAQLRKDRPVKNQNLAGTVMLSADVNGSAQQWRQMTGKGSLTISDGYLWKWEVLEGVSRALLIPEFQSLVFTQGRADFSIRDGRLQSTNAQISGKRATFKGKGWVDFDGNINFDIKPIFSKAAIASSESARKGPTSILTQTEGYLNIKLTGTLQHPVHKVDQHPGKLLKETIGGTTNTIKEVIGGIVEGIF